MSTSVGNGALFLISYGTLDDTNQDPLQCSANHYTSVLRLSANKTAFVLSNCRVILRTISTEVVEIGLEEGMNCELMDP